MLQPDVFYRVKGLLVRTSCFVQKQRLFLLSFHTPLSRKKCTAKITYLISYLVIHTAEELVRIVDCLS